MAKIYDFPLGAERDKLRHEIDRERKKQRRVKTDRKSVV